MKKEFYSNGKLLLTGEYVVLDGAKALALPTKFGQSLVIEPATNFQIEWTSFDHDHSIWFNSIITFESIIQNKIYTEDPIAQKLIEILHEAYKLNPNFVKNAQGYKITTHLTFPKNWGLGTSSTLINNISEWLQIDAYTLLKNSFGGSGYDLACAKHNSAIVYQLINEKPIIHKTPFHPTFSDKIHFVYLNKKQNSRTAIASYLSKQGKIEDVVQKINTITQIVLESKKPNEFALALQKHEIEMSNVLEQQTIQEALFEDFDGVIKSLGAWGGDFVLAISKENPTQYFKNKGYPIIISYQDMIL